MRWTAFTIIYRSRSIFPQGEMNEKEEEKTLCAHKHSLALSYARTNQLILIYFFFLMMYNGVYDNNRNFNYAYTTKSFSFLFFAGQIRKRIIFSLNFVCVCARANIWSFYGRDNYNQRCYFFVSSLACFFLFCVFVYLYSISPVRYFFSSTSFFLLKYSIIVKIRIIMQEWAEQQSL